MLNNNIVPFADLSRTYLPLKNEINQAIQKVIDSSAFILGIEVEKFENKFSKYLKVKYCAGVSSGTSALQMALKACNIGNGDEVITTSHSWGGQQCSFMPGLGALSRTDFFGNLVCTV